MQNISHHESFFSLESINRRKQSKPQQCMREELNEISAERKHHKEKLWSRRLELNHCMRNGCRGAAYLEEFTELYLYAQCSRCGNRSGMKSYACHGKETMNKVIEEWNSSSSQSCEHRIKKEGWVMEEMQSFTKIQQGE